MTVTSRSGVWGIALGGFSLEPEFWETYGPSLGRCYAKTHAERNGYMALDDVLDQSRLAYFLRFLPHSTPGKPAKLVRAFGGNVRFEEAMRELQDLLYQD